MPQLKPFCVMIATPAGNGTIVETRYGRWFASIDAVARAARRVGGAVYERSSMGLRLRLDHDYSSRSVH